MAVMLSCRALSKAYDAHPLFEELAFGLHEGERVGLIGPNGSGKSTLIRILAGMEEPDEGERVISSGVRLAYLPQRDEFPAGATARSVITAAVEAEHPHEEDHQRSLRIETTLSDAGFCDAVMPRDAQDVAALSGGWRKRLAIARALAADPDLLLMDEPTNHLDLEGIWWLEGVLAETRATCLVVSHDRFFLERVCQRVVELNRLYPGGCFSSTGGYATFLEKRAEFVANQRKQQDVLDNVVRREIEWLRRNPAAQTCKSKARVDRAGDLQADLAGLKYRNAQVRRVNIEFSASGRRTNDLVVLDGISKSLGGRPLFSDVGLTLSPGTRLGVLGLNGSGKTTLLRILTKQLAADSGTVKHATDLKVVVFDQKRERLDQKQLLRKALCPTGQTVVYRGRASHVAAWAKRFLFSANQLDLEVSKLSGGEQARVLIANLMLREADLLILDEPTNDLDIPSLEVLEASLIDFPGAVALVTHDRYLLDRVSTDIIALDGTGGAYRVSDCSQWESLAARLDAARNKTTAPPPPKPAPSRGAPQQLGGSSGGGLAKNERRELERMEEKLQTAEQLVATLESQVGDPAVAGDPVRMEKACAELAAAQSQVEKIYSRWAELEAKARGSR